MTYRRIAIVGNNKSGKTSFINFVRGLEFNRRHLKNRSQEEYLVQWRGDYVIMVDNPVDLEEYSEIIVIYDLSDNKGFQSILKYLLYNKKITIVGNKSDCNTFKQDMSDFDYVECSCKSAKVQKCKTLKNKK